MDAISVEARDGVRGRPPAAPPPPSMDRDCTGAGGKGGGGRAGMVASSVSFSSAMPASSLVVGLGAVAAALAASNTST